MSKIVPKLNLNKTPQLVDNNSLVMAKNIRLLEDGTIGPDTSLEEIETNIGDQRTREIQHEEITEDVTIYQYSILDIERSIVIAEGGTIDEEYLDDYVFYFSVDNDDPYDDNYNKSNEAKYVRYEDEALIYCYDFINETIRWNSYKFKYDYNDNYLINKDGHLFLLAIREDVYGRNPDTSLESPQFVYLVLPKEYIDETINITINEVVYNYTVVNPVYQTTRIWHHIIQPEYTETEIWYDTVAYIAQIVGLNNKVYFFKESNLIKDSTEARGLIRLEYPGARFEDEDVPVLPYVELEYIESSGTQYIQTDYNVTSDTQFDSKIKYNQNDNSVPFAGSWVSGQQFYIQGENNSNNKRFCYNAAYSVIFSDLNPHVIKYTNDKLYVDDIEKLTFTFSGTNENLRIFDIYVPNVSTNYKFNGRIYYLKLYNGNTLVHHFIPVKRRSDNVICMYDLISEEFFTNAGTGDFIAGPEVQQEVTSNSNSNSWTPDWRNSGGYIESSGTQYIDTGITPSNTIKVEVYGAILENINNYSILGSNTSGELNKTFHIGCVYNSNMFVSCGGNNIQIPFDTNNHLYEIDVLNSIIKLDSTTAQITNYSTSGVSIYAFGVHFSNYSTILSKSKIFYLKIWNNNELVREMYPAIVNNVPCMYDYVTGTYFYNQGTGDFTVSQEVIDASIQPSGYAEFSVNSDNYVLRNKELFKDSSIARALIPNINDRVKIFEYDEVENTFEIVRCAWKYNGGINIRGCVSVNSTGEHILTICESGFDYDILIPIKHINLSKCTEEDNESFYTQAPNIPISNLKLSGRYIKNIPAGVYQFFIRYKIHDNFYTTWFPCSKELFAATRKQIDTLQGTIKHADVHEDSNNSFVFTIEHLFPEYCDNFEQYQLGFIVSSDGGVFARSWKHFDMNVSSTDSIYFEYNKDDIEEIDIDELLKVNYDLFNVENITQYKNRLYISNYKETDFNEDLSNLAKEIKVKLKLSEVSVSSGVYFNDIPLHQSAISGIYDSFGGTSISETFRNSLYCNINTSEEVSAISSEYEVSKETYQNAHSHITKVYILYNDTKYYLYGGDDTDADIEVETYNSNVIINRFIDEIKNNIIGIDSNGNYKYNSSTIIEIDNIYVEYKTYTKRTEIYHEGPDEHEDSGHTVIEYYLTCYTHNITDIITLKQSIISSSYKYNEYNTLLPFTKYDFYIHYVKQNGIVTNGYFIGTKEINRYCKGYTQVTEGYPDRPDAMTVLYGIDNLDDICFYRSNNEEYAYYDDESTRERSYYKLIEETTGQSIIYPSFTNIKCPEGYVGCFISVCKYGNNVAQGFNYEYNSSNNTHKIDCLELDTLLYNTQSNIKIKASTGINITENAVYCSSSTTTPVKHLGCSGHIEFVKAGAISTKCWIIFDSVNKPYNKTLQKLTPYIKLNSTIAINYNNYIDLNSPGYYCEVIKLNRQFCDAEYEDENNNPTGYYVSGTDIYVRNITADEINLEEVTEKVDYHNSNINYIFSNFNLNYVSLTNDLTPSIRSYDIVENNSRTSYKQFITLVNSLTASFILELKSMYRDYTKKLYYEYTKNKITKFDNTIRVSSLDVDEIYRYIYRFEATDYYNVPTHRGIITNLVAVVNTLYVHCEHSLFKFSDNKTIDAQDEQVVLQENDIFNSGISEVFDAQYGYAGLQNREQSLITYNAYVFYDAVAKIIYAFGGEQQIGNISEPIKKLIKAIDPIDVQFVGDELHNRFFVNLINNNGNVCLSFNFGSKSFIAVHDITFKFGFHSRRHTYFVHDNMYNGYKIGWSIYRIADTVDGNFIAYQNCYEPSLIQIADCDNILLNPVKSVNACVDVIINTEYEKIKQLDYISWICSEILEYGDDENLIAEEVLNRKYPGTKLRIYSDSTQSDLFELLKSNGDPKISNEERNVNANDEPNPNPNSWQYPQYNCGVWSMNYFRDILNTGDIFHYKASKNKITGGIGHSKTTNLIPKSQRENLTQESSLIYGKYFVLRFIFNNKNFKLENVMLKMNDYGKTK